MTKKCPNYTLQPNQRHREEETQRNKNTIKVKQPAISSSARISQK